MFVPQRDGLHIMFIQRQRLYDTCITTGYTIDAVSHVLKADDVQ